MSILLLFVDILQSRDKAQNQSKSPIYPFQKTIKLFFKALFMYG